jgi:dTDP-4-amino-4,6-dideoxy-D-galactose acyltransferase
VFSLRIEKDQWLSDVLAIPSWKVLGIEAGTSPAEIRAGLLDRAGRSAAFFTARIPTRGVAAVTSAARAGFNVVDVNVTFDWDHAANDASGGIAASRDSVDIEAANAGETASVEQIAGRCFTLSRFHLDPCIGLARANEVKRQWAGNACRGRASAVYVARRKGGIAGFLAVLESKSGEIKDAIIDLVGVDADHQGQGIGRALSRTFLDRWRGRADRLRVGTQISNIAAMRLYESIGFRVTETSYVLHAHANNGAVAA